MTTANKKLGAADLENKDLATFVDAKAEEAEELPEAPDPEVEVEMLHHHAYEGRQLLPGDKIKVPARIAGSWIAAFYAKRV